jgi:predicted negative regulator of RcsB-dependent stress response
VRSYTRHQLKEDQFRTTAKETASWVVAHRQKLVYGAVAVVVVLAIVAGTWAYLQQQDETAGVALGHAVQVYQAPLTGGQPSQPGVTSFASQQDRAKAARAEFAKVAEKYSHTNSAEMARYFMGLADSEAGNTAAAEKELKEVAGSGRSDVAALAKFALASLYRNQGKDTEAVPLYKDLIEHPTNTVAKSQAQMELASVYEPKQPQDARTLYQQVQKENPDSPAGQMAANRLSELK